MHLLWPHQALAEQRVVDALKNSHWEAVAWRELRRGIELVVDHWEVGGGARYGQRGKAGSWCQSVMQPPAQQGEHWTGSLLSEALSHGQYPWLP
jgi:hypothetical protein